VHLVNPVNPVNMVFDCRWLYGPAFLLDEDHQDVREYAAQKEIDEQARWVWG
jgi:hypothetical protein